MKDIDDTDPPKSESELTDDELRIAFIRVNDRIRELEKRIANLETQRTPQDENDDPEWYS